jgi:hypothetical protein
MKFRVLHYIALKVSRLSSWLHVLVIREANERSARWHDSDVAENRLKTLAKVLWKD